MVQVLADVVMPQCVITTGVRGKQVRRNDRVTNQGGFMSANIVWDTTLREFEVGIKPMDPEAWSAIEGIFEVTDAGAYGFLMPDPKDSVAVLQPLQPYNPPSGNIGTAGQGFGIPTYRLTRQYTVQGSTRTRLRRIARPRAGLVVRRNGTIVPSGVSAGEYAIDLNTGTVTFVPDASRSVAAVTVGASTQVTLASAIAGLTVGGQLWLVGLGGADAAVLNNMSFSVSAIAGAVYTLTVNTAGKTINTGGGSATAAKYPQTTDTLTWSGEFFVPVQFQADEIDWELVRPGHIDDRLIAGPSVALVEVRE